MQLLQCSLLLLYPSGRGRGVKQHASAPGEEYIQCNMWIESIPAQHAHGDCIKAVPACCEWWASLWNSDSATSDMPDRCARSTTATFKHFFDVVPKP